MGTGYSSDDALAMRPVIVGVVDGAGLEIRQMNIASVLGTLAADELPSPRTGGSGSLRALLAGVGLMDDGTEGIDLQTESYTAYYECRQADPDMDEALLGLASNPLISLVNAACDERSRAVQDENDAARAAASAHVKRVKEERAHGTAAMRAFCENYFEESKEGDPHKSKISCPYEVIQDLVLRLPTHTEEKALEEALESAVEQYAAGDGELSAASVRAKAVRPKGRASAGVRAARYAEGDGWSFDMEIADEKDVVFLVDGLTLSEARILKGLVDEAAAETGELPFEVGLLAQAAADHRAARRHEPDPGAEALKCRSLACANIARFCAPRVTAINNLRRRLNAGEIDEEAYRDECGEIREDMADELSRPTWRTSACLSNVVERMVQTGGDETSAPHGAEDELDGSLAAHPELCLEDVS